MTKTFFYQELLIKFKKIAKDNNFLNDKVVVTGKILTPKEAIGNPKRSDYPLVKGKEKLIEAEFKGKKGQAFTDLPGVFNGTLKEMTERPLKTNFDRAILIATINAVARHLGTIEKTVHCKNNAPEKCARQLIHYIKNKYGSPKIALIGLQPVMLEQLANHFKVRVADLDKDKIGKTYSSVQIENGSKNIEELLKWSNLIVATGSTVVNSTITDFLNDDKPTIFFGTTIAAPAALMGLEHFCNYSS